MRKKSEVEADSRINDEHGESPENSTQNTRKKILPERANRGLRMKSLEGRDLDQENELYDLIFAEKSSDEDFDPSQTEFSADESDMEVQEEEVENEEIDSKKQEKVEASKLGSKQKENKINVSSEKMGGSNMISNRRRKHEEEIVDLDMLDLDKIDEMEDKREKGIDIEEEAVEGSSEEISEDEVSPRKKKKKNKKVGKKSKKYTPLVLVEDGHVEDKKKSHLRKSFIDYDDDEEFLGKKQKPANFLRSKRQVKKAKKEVKKIPPPRLKFNKNVTLSDDFESIFINKSVLEKGGEGEGFSGEEEMSCNAYEEDRDDIMKYNDESYSYKQKIKNIEEENTNTKNIIKKYKKNENVNVSPGQANAPVKYSFMQEKLSQKELLLEAIFTEYYNIQSLQEMQKLEDLNKKDFSTPDKKQFSEYVRIIKRSLKPNNGEEKKVEEEKEKDNEIEDEMNKNITLSTPGKEMESISVKMNEDVNLQQPKPPQHETCVTFSNPLLFEKLFEKFNTNPQAALANKPQEQKVCVITNLPAKYFDPLTKQYYANKEAFKVIRERYFQKEEDNLLFRIQTLSDLASQKKEKLKKLLLSEGEGISGNSSKNLINMVSKYGILKSDPTDFDKKVVSRKNLTYILFITY